MHIPPLVQNLIVAVVSILLTQLVTTNWKSEALTYSATGPHCIDAKCKIQVAISNVGSASAELVSFEIPVPIKEATIADPSRAYDLVDKKDVRIVTVGPLHAGQIFQFSLVYADTSGTRLTSQDFASFSIYSKSSGARFDGTARRSDSDLELKWVLFGYLLSIAVVAMLYWTFRNRHVMDLTGIDVLAPTRTETKGGLNWDVEPDFHRALGENGRLEGFSLNGRNNSSSAVELRSATASSDITGARLSGKVWLKAAYRVFELKDIEPIPAGAEFVLRFSFPQPLSAEDVANSWSSFSLLCGCDEHDRSWIFSKAHVSRALEYYLPPAGPRVTLKPGKT